LIILLFIVYLVVLSKLIYVSVWLPGQMMFSGYCTAYPAALIECIHQLHPLALSYMVNHLVIGYREQIGFGRFTHHRIPVLPHLLKCCLYNVSRVLGMLEILQNEPVHTICMGINTVIVFSLSHCVLGE